MNLLTIDTLAALATVHRQLPEVLMRLLAGQLTADDLRAFADLLAEAADLVSDHAEDQARGIVQLQRSAEPDADDVLASVTALGSRS